MSYASACPAKHELSSLRRPALEVETTQQRHVYPFTPVVITLLSALACLYLPTCFCFCLCPPPAPPARTVHLQPCCNATALQRPTQDLSINKLTDERGSSISLLHDACTPCARKRRSESPDAAETHLSLVFHQIHYV